METPLTIAVLGLDEAGMRLLEAAKGLDIFKIAAVADSNAAVAQEAGKLWNCPAYDDYRRLIIQNQLDCLFVAAPIHTCADYLKMALKKKFNILKLPPLARNFSEAAEFVKLAQAEGVTFTVANASRFAKPALAMRNFIIQNTDEQFSFVFAGAGIKNAQNNALQAKWRSDPVLAGGGVVLYDCWEIIDQIVSNFGLPQQVYCVTGNTATDRQQRLYLAEDSAAVTMKFSDTLSATLLAGKAAEATHNSTDSQKWLIAQGQRTLLKFEDKRFEVTDAQGFRREDFDDDFLSGMKNSIENFGSYLLSPDKNPLICTAADNLKNMAIIEAAYLSVRTGMPEEPAKILKIA